MRKGIIMRVKKTLNITHVINLINSLYPLNNQQNHQAFHRIRRNDQPNSISRSNTGAPQVRWIPGRVLSPAAQGKIKHRSLRTNRSAVREILRIPKICRLQQFFTSTKTKITTTT
jgi:hypothetical protein